MMEIRFLRHRWEELIWMRYLIWWKRIFRSRSAAGAGKRASCISVIPSRMMILMPAPEAVWDIISVDFTDRIWQALTISVVRLCRRAKKNRRPVCLDRVMVPFIIILWENSVCLLPIYKKASRDVPCVRYLEITVGRQALPIWNIWQIIFWCVVSTILCRMLFHRKHTRTRIVRHISMRTDTIRSIAISVTCAHIWTVWQAWSVEERSYKRWQFFTMPKASGPVSVCVWIRWQDLFMMHRSISLSYRWIIWIRQTSLSMWSCLMQSTSRSRSPVYPMSSMWMPCRMPIPWEKMPCKKRQKTRRKRRMI